MLEARSAADPAPQGAQPAPGRWTLLFGVLLVASAALRLLYAPHVPLTGDELMHWQWSRHLAAGYPEHPPLVAWLIAASTSLFGTSGFTVRLVPITAMTVVFAGAFVLGRRLFGERAAVFGAAPLMTAPIFNAGGVLANTDSLLACFWILTVLALERAVIAGRRGAWLAAGVSAGLALLSKLPALFLFPATALFLAATPEGRRWARRFEPYAAAALALLLFSPVVWWNVRHGLFTIAMRVGHQSAGGLSLKFPAELFAAQGLTVSPLLLVWVLWGLVRAIRGRRDLRLALLASFMLVPFGFYFAYSLFARSGIHWPAIGYPTGFLAAGAASALSPGRRTAARLLALACAPALLITALLYVIPLVPDKITWNWAYAVQPRKVNTAQLDNIFDWGDLGREVRRELELTEPGAFVLCRDGYGLAGLVSFYTPGRPAVFLWDLQRRNGAAYDMWREEADLVGRDAVIVEDRPNVEWFDTLRGRFDTLSAPRIVEIRRGGEVLRRFWILHGTGFSGFPAAQQPTGPSR